MVKVSSISGTGSLQDRQHSLRVILEVLRLCQLIIFCCSIFASQNKLLGRNYHLKQNTNRNLSVLTTIYTTNRTK